ncbi:ubiquinol-cytochrome-c reductase subunit [Cavenderia fasciculata]|uniref:Complex III subunit 9 n=1 Tax=Cavenderia fasciculata TaxID=261658 RepID=F4PIQ1_CACFS|nr:ubiquinol-cytochrome-c reductase subunit [Cavenderia fasciculata]EGG24630.1 ubiquinol-cytochrome-c reductase subunit [Cavenderia fasciculata]|eukprot:XP_004362481.1 ubiquinol-cytochrome-c reductase subunit [Cavenderia fasciculata]
MSNFTGFLYKTVFSRNSTFITAAIITGFVFEQSVHGVVDVAFASANSGKIWKDVYAQRQAKGISE